MRLFILIAFLGLTGCMQTQSEDDDLRTVPVTNNPYIVPNHGSGMPMTGI